MENQVKEELKIREDLNVIVESIKFKTISNKFGTRNVCIVTLFNKETIEFKDAEGVFELFMSYTKCGEKDFVKSVKLVDEISKEKEDKEPRVYTCVLYELKDGSTYRLFPSKFVSNKIIDNYYNLYKKNQKPSAVK